MAVAVPSRARVPRSIAGGSVADGAGRSGVDRGGGRGGVADIQRARMIAAMAGVARQRGVGATTVADVVARSGVSRRTFYELFEDRDDCFRAAFDQAIERAARRVVPAYESAEGWRERMRAGLAALLEFLDDEPDLGALCVVDALGAGPFALERRAKVVGVLIDAVHEGRREVMAGTKPTRLTAEGVIGAVLAVLHARLVGREASPDGTHTAGARAAGAQTTGARAVGAQTTGARPSGAREGVRSMTRLLGPLMGMIVLPYLGQAAAAQEISRRSPRRGRAAPSNGDPLRELDMRLTYRTVRALLAIGELAMDGRGPSNRQVADAAGVADPGQISKLLARLEHLELIANDGGPPARGEPNVWRLTPKGQEIERTIRRQATPVGA